MYNIDYYTTSTLVYNISRLLNIENLNFKNLCIFILQNKLIKNEINLVINSDIIHTHNTRLANKIHIDHTLAQIWVNSQFCLKLYSPITLYQNKYS
jgi:hypothetical protein